MKSLKALRARLFGSPLMRGVSILVGGNAAAQVINLLASLILARVYSPDEFGVFAVFIAICTMGTVVASLRYNMAIPLPHSNEAGVALTLAALLATVGFSTLAFLTLLAFGGSLFELVGLPVKGIFWILIPVSLLLGGAYQVLTSWAVRTRDFVTISSTRFTQSLGVSLGQIGAAPVMATALGLPVGYVVGQVFGISRLSRSFLGTWRRMGHRPNLKALWRAAYEYRRFPLYSTGSGLLYVAGLHGPAFILAINFTTYQVGLLAMAQRILLMPVNLVTTAITQVFIGEVSRIRYSEPASVRALFRHLLIRTALPSVPLFILFAMAAPSVFALVLGETWRPAGQVARALAPLYIASFNVEPIAASLQVYERLRLALHIDLARTVLGLGVLSLAIYSGKPMLQALSYFAWTVCVVYIVTAVVCYRIIPRRPRGESGGPLGDEKSSRLG